jgi:hypothetical protein
MKKSSLKKSNFLSRAQRRSTFLIALTATALSASIVACGPTQTRTPPNGNIPAASTGALPQAAPQLPASPKNLTDVSQFPAAQLSAIAGTYGGKAAGTYTTDEYADATLILSPATIQGQTGQFFQVTFTLEGKVFNAYAQTSKQSGYFGVTNYFILSYPQYVPGLNSYEEKNPVQVFIQLSVTASNQVDPTSFKVSILDGVFFQNVVDFEDVLKKR